jgi:hypothetical protein
MKYCLMGVILGITLSSTFAQTKNLQPGFDAAEYSDMLHLGFKAFKDTATHYSLQKGKYNRLFLSPEVGLYNCCEIFLRSDNIAVISLRGTIGKTESWMENFFAGMVAATGSLQLNDITFFNYKLAENNNAYVHIGWLLGLGFLSPYINHEVDSLIAKGITSFIVAGHSQGGALAFLTTSYLHYRNPSIQIKSYCSAAPKPGNLYYAYDFDFISRNGYAFRVVNSDDWVPETPISIQTFTDLKHPNPLLNAGSLFGKQSFFVRLALKHMFNKMQNGSVTARNRFRKYLGEKLYTQVRKSLPQLKKPHLVYSNYYSTAGNPVILLTDSAYHSKFVFDGKNYFVHHSLKAYEYLLQQYYK